MVELRDCLLGGRWGGLEGLGGLLELLEDEGIDSLSARIGRVLPSVAL